MPYQCQIPLAGLPITLVLISTAQIAFVPVQKFKPIFDIPEKTDGINAAFFEDHFKIDDQPFQYNVAYQYKEIKPMLLWLINQNLIEPN